MPSLPSLSYVLATRSLRGDPKFAPQLLNLLFNRPFLGFKVLLLQFHEILWGRNLLHTITVPAELQ